MRGENPRLRNRQLREDNCALGIKIGQFVAQRRDGRLRNQLRLQGDDDRLAGPALIAYLVLGQANMNVANLGNGNCDIAFPDFPGASQQVDQKFHVYPLGRLSRDLGRWRRTDPEKIRKNFGKAV
jgi:hypothetical protein